MQVNKWTVVLKLQTQLQNLSCIMRNASAVIGAPIAGIDCIAWTSDVLSNPYGRASARRLHQVSRWEQVLEAQSRNIQVHRGERLWHYDVYEKTEYKTNGIVFYSRFSTYCTLKREVEKDFLRDDHWYKNEKDST